MKSQLPVGFYQTDFNQSTIDLTQEKKHGLD